jgi:hypothetical protein
MKSSVLLAFASAIFLALLAIPANAQATRTWVSGVGDDVNPCSRTAPCKTFAGAISKTASPGEINCLDPAGFGAVTITKAISIICDGVSNGGVLVAGTDGIDVNLSSAGQVVLSGFDFEGLSPGSGPGINGVGMLGQGKLIIRNSTIRDFGNYGVNVQGAASARVVVINTLITNCAGGGIYVQGASGASNNVLVENSILDNNANFAVSVSGASTIYLMNSILTGGTGIVNSGGTVISYGNNVIRNGGTPTTTSPLQ